MIVTSYKISPYRLCQIEMNIDGRLSEGVAWVTEIDKYDHHFYYI